MEWETQSTLITPEMIEWFLPKTINQAQLSEFLGVSRATITGRINRKTLPPFDGSGKTWKYETISHILKTSNDIPTY